MANIFRTASLWLKIATVCMALGLLLFIIGFATVSWMISRHYRADIDIGLWGGSDSRLHPSYREFGSGQVNDYHRSIQAMECLGLIGFVGAIVVLLMYMVADTFRRRDFLQFSIAATFGGLLFACIGFAIFGSSSNENNLGRGGDVGWSMGIACAGAAFYGLAGIMLIIQLIK